MQYCDSISLLPLENLVTCDVEKEMMIDDAEVQSYVTRKYRAPWTLST